MMKAPDCLKTGLFLLVLLVALLRAGPHCPAQELQESEPERLPWFKPSPSSLPNSLLPDAATSELTVAKSDMNWKPPVSSEGGLRLWDCIALALENNRPLMNAREDLRISQITLRERQEEFGEIYTLGAGAHYDENLAHTDSSRYSFSLGGAEGGVSGIPDGAVVSRRFASGGSLSLGVRSTYHSTEIPRIQQLLDSGGNPVLDDQGNPIYLTRFDAIRWFSEANLVVTQPLLEGAGEVATTDLRIQELDKAATNLTLERFIQTVVSDVVRNYLAVQRAISVAKVQRESCERAIDLFIYTRESKRFRRAPTGPMDLARGEQQVTSTHQQFVDAENNVYSALVDLKLTMGLEPERDIILSGTKTPTVDPFVLPLPEAIQAAFRQRPDLRALDLLKKQTELVLKAAHNALLPNLDLSARMGFHEEKDDFAESWGLFFYEDAGADLRLNLPLNLPSDKANFQRSQISLKQAINNIQQNRRIVANNVSETYYGQKNLRDRLSILRRNEKLAKETFRIFSGWLEFGQDDKGNPINAFDQAQAQNDLTAASVALARAEIDYVIAMALLDLSTGRPISEVLGRYSPQHSPPPK
jgi:outer membrane protein TolC